MANKAKQPRYVSLPPACFRPQGWIREYLLRDAAGIIGNLDRLCTEASSGIFFEHQVVDQQEGFWSSWWNGETEGNWMDAFIHLSFLLPDEQLIKQAKAYLDRLVVFQEPDGYLGVYQPAHRYQFDGDRSGEFWTQSRILLILLNGYQVTGNARYLQALERLTARIMKSYRDGSGPVSYFGFPDADGSKGHGLMIIEPLLIAGRITGQADVADFCEKLYADFSTHPSPFPGNDCRLPNLLDPDRPFVGHGPHTCEHLRIPLLLYYQTGKKVYWQAFQAGLHKLKQNLTLSGSCKSDELIGVYPPDVPAAQRSPADLRGSLPLPSAGYEFCSTSELSIGLVTALTLTGDLRFADQQEWLLFNAAKAAKRSDGKAIQYLCADNLFAATRQRGERWDYSPTHTDAAVCCAPNSGKVMPTHVLNSWLCDSKDQALVAVLYGPCQVHAQVQDEQVIISEETGYPFEKSVRFHLRLKRSLQFPIKLRIPAWAEAFQILVNQEQGQARIESDRESRLAVIERTWQDGDELSLRMDWQPVVRLAVDGSAAVSYGPLLYCLRIAEQAEYYHAYPVDGFYDTNYTPAASSQWDYTFQLDQDGLPGKFITPVEHKIRPDDYEWEHPPVTLQAVMLNRDAQPETVQLVPLGSTILRRTTFPWVRC
jgi:uncharacterized protein